MTEASMQHAALITEVRDKYAKLYFPEAIYLSTDQLDRINHGEEDGPADPILCKVHELSDQERRNLAASWGRIPEPGTRVAVQMCKVPPCTHQLKVNGSKPAIEFAVRGLFREYRKRIDAATMKRGFKVSKDHPIFVRTGFGVGFAALPGNLPVVMMGTNELGVAGLDQEHWALPET